MLCPHSALRANVFQSRSRLTVPGAGLPRQIPIQHDFVERPILTMFSWRFLRVQPVPAQTPGTNVPDNASLAASVLPKLLPNVDDVAMYCADANIVTLLH